MGGITPKMALDHFVIERKTYGVKPLSTGYINDTYTIFDGHVPVFLLQRVNEKVFHDIPGLMENLEAVLPALKGMGYHPVSFYYTKARHPYYCDKNGQYWRLMSFVPNGVSYDFTTDPDIAFESGRILGIFHRLTEKIATKSIKEILVGFHHLSKREGEFKMAVENASEERKQKAREEISFANDLLEKLHGNRPIDLPLRICHNDTKLNNFLFDSKTGKGLCLVDLDTVMPGYLHYDLGDAIRILANPNPEDERDLEKITFDLHMVKTFLEGIRESGLELSESERLAIPYGAILMPFLHGIRALTDYLQHDRYYRVTYPQENLNRARSLFAVALKASENSAALAGIVKEVF
ncbi:phosphotransferase enzyme family protein [Muriicola marianensis]|uniref:Mucin desulfatase n=1 Tax=Muriicola marianensis TaxID=1324801 RepID=A0ABQ1QWI8_9FLAO|nr:aminoglycoside phosphotransferase family protein [Muriicola marianensis]GGD47478.1 mucin desulfatase [Muriicola marianensis]